MLFFSLKYYFLRILQFSKLRAKVRVPYKSIQKSKIHRKLINCHKKKRIFANITKEGFGCMNVKFFVFLCYNF